MQRDDLSTLIIIKKNENKTKQNKYRVINNKFFKKTILNEIVKKKKKHYQLPCYKSFFTSITFPSLKSKKEDQK